MRLGNQRAYAKRVFHFITDVDAPQLHQRALWAFNSIPVSDRTPADYERAVRVAMKHEDFRLALSINAEATGRELNRDCSTFLLLHCTSNMLWRTAAEVWRASFSTYIRQFSSSSPPPVAVHVMKEAGNYHNLPFALTQLASQLLQRQPIVVHHAGTLLILGGQLLHVVAKNATLMSLITPSGMLGLLDNFVDLRQLGHRVYLNAIDTLLRSTRALDKSGLSALIYRHLRQHFPEFKPSPALFGSLISINHDEGASFETFTYYLREFATFHGAADRNSYQRVLVALAEQGDVAGVQSIFRDLCQVHSRPTEVPFYSPLLQVYARLGDVEGAQREFQRMKDWGVEPDIYCWNILMSAHARSPAPRGAMDVYGRMRAEGVDPDVFTFSTLMGIFSKVGDTEAVLDIIEQAQQFHIKGSHNMIAGLAHSYCLNNQVDIAERLAEATTSANFEGEPVKVWNYILRHHAFQAESDGVLRVQERMRSLGVKPDDMTYAALMTALVVIGKTKDAAKILRKLALSQVLAPTSFHYAIILHGYAQEGNRDQANVIYREMVDRFPKLGASPRLAMLHLQTRRTIDSGKTPYAAIDHLAQTLAEITEEARASRQPQPGFGRRGAVDSAPSIFMEHLTHVLVGKGRINQADKLLQRYDSLAKSSYLNVNPDDPESIPLLTTRLAVSTHKQDWEGVDGLWTQIVASALRVATPFSSTPSSQVFDDKGQVLPPAPKVAAGIGLHEDESASESVVESVYSREGSAVSMLSRPGLKVLPAQRHLLQSAINMYLRSLDVRQLHASAIALVQRLEKAGFTLTSKNWNFFVQVLTRSNDPEHMILAFQVYEEKLLANTPPWRFLRRGKWTQPSSPGMAPRGRLEVFSRETIEKLNPDQLMPTYVTTVYLATVVRSFNNAAVNGDKARLLKLKNSAPGTYRLIRHLPRLKDRFQGVLLRGTKIRGDLTKKPPPATADRSGVLGSSSPLDHVPVDELYDVDEVVRRKPTAAKDETEESADDSRARDLRQAELYEGEIVRSRMWVEKKRRLETADELRQRIETEEARLLKTMDAIRRDASRSRSVSDVRFGRPAMPRSSPSVRTGDRGKAKGLTDGALFDPEDVRLEEMAVARREMRAGLVAASHDTLERSRTRRRAGPRKFVAARPKSRVQIPTLASSTPVLRSDASRHLLDRLIRGRKLAVPGKFDRRRRKFVTGRRSRSTPFRRPAPSSASTSETKGDPSASPSTTRTDVRIPVRQQEEKQQQAGREPGHEGRQEPHGGPAASPATATATATTESNDADPPPAIENASVSWSPNARGGEDLDLEP
jgi:pentatricopeptide repeat protein